MRIYPLTRWLSILLLLIYLGVRLELPPSWWSELIIFNSVVFASILAILASQIQDDLKGRWAVVAALGGWGLGSITSSIDSFFGTELGLLSEIGYLFFYPFILFGIVRSLRFEERSQSLEIIDTLLIAFSGTTLLASLFLKPASYELAGSEFEVFLGIIYPIADLVLLLTVMVIIILQQLSPRNLLILSGITVFTISDFYYLWISQSGSYVFGSISDAGWLIAFVLISQAFWFRISEDSNRKNFNPAFVSFALVLSSLILTVAVMRPDYFPRFVLIPALLTIALAFLRMSVAMKDVRRMSDERILARTDELTGLANRRRFLAEYELFQRKIGSLLILDLDGFKPVNDQLGHDIGDQLLIQVSRRFQRVMPRDALLARLGGDEFGALIIGHDGHEIALALRATVSYPFKVASHEVRLDVSIGEVFNDGEAGELNLLSCADEAMYAAKRQRTGVVRWSPSIRS